MRDRGRSRQSHEAGLPTYTLACFLFCLSGAAGLCCEIIWVRLLGLAFGHTVYATSAVLTAFMAGLALGSYASGKWNVDDPRAALRVFAALHLAIAVYVAVSPSLLQYLGAFAIVIGRWTGGSLVAASVCQLTGALMALLPGTALMGAALPMLVRAFSPYTDGEDGVPITCSSPCAGHDISPEKRFRATLGGLYGINALGAALGCVGTIFWLIPALGVNGSIAAASGVFLFVGAGGLLLSLATRLPARRAQEPVVGEVAQNAICSSVRHVAWLLTLCGFCGLSLQNCWTRLLMPTVGVDVQAFGLVVAAVLFGIAGGGLLTAWGRLNRFSPARLFALALLLAGISSAASVPLLWSVAALAQNDAMPRLCTRLTCAFSIVLVPALCMGGALPVGASLLRLAVAQAGRAAGIALAWNTAGAVAGALVSGFVLIPLLGVSQTIIALACVYVLMSVAAIRTSRDRASFGRIGLTGGLAFAVTAIAAAYASRIPPVAMRYSSDTHRIAFYQEGVSCSLAVIEDVRDRSLRTLDVNGQIAANTGCDSAATYKLLGHVPCLLHPKPRDALAIGFGAGMTAASILMHVDRLDCVEIEPAQRVAAWHFRAANRDVLSDPRFRFHVADGRTFLSVQSQQYDVIVLDRMHPRICQDLFAVEFLRLCRERLKQNGLMCFCLPTGLCPSVAEIKTLVRTFVSEFAHTGLWYLDSRTSLLIGSARLRDRDVSRLVRALDDPEIGADLGAVGLIHAEDLLARLVAEGDELRSWAGRCDIVEDDLPIGFCWPDRGLEGDDVRTWIQEVLRLRRSSPCTDTADQDERLRRAHAMTDGLIIAHQAFLDSDFDSAARICEDLLRASPKHQAPARLAARAYEGKARDLWKVGRKGRAATIAARAVALAPNFPRTHATLGMICEDLGRTAAAVAAYQRAVALNPLYDYGAKRLQGLRPE